MDINPILQNLNNPQDLQRLRDYIRELYRECDMLYLTADPNGTVSARRGRQALCFVGGNYYISVNTDGSTTWKKTTNLS